jgi:hypothetical protein
MQATDFHLELGYVSQAESVIEGGSSHARIAFSSIENYVVSLARTRCDTL